jgi:hypothetical protein
MSRVANLTLLLPIERPFVVENLKEDSWDVTMNDLVRFERGQARVSSASV